MSRKQSHFSIDAARPTTTPTGRPQHPAKTPQEESQSKEELQKHAAQEYARRGVERVYQEQLKQRRQAEEEGIKLSKEQLEKYHQSWGEYYHQYYHQYYSEYYNKYFGKVKEDVTNFQNQSHAKLNELASDNKLLIEQKRRLEDPEAIRRDLLNRIVERGKESSFWSRIHRHVRSISVAALAASFVLFVQFNPVVVGAIKQYLGPSSSASLPSIIEPSSSSSVNQSPTLIISKIGLKVPVIFDEPSYENSKVQKALERGVVRYWNTSSPGETGNVAILGHSSNNLLNPGNYKYAFVNLRRLEVDDVIYLDYQNIRYAYKVTSKAIAPPTELGYIQPTKKPSLTLITCDPPGTDNNRLYVVAEQISPDPANNKIVQKEEDSSTPQEIPTSAPSFWSNIF